MNKVETFTSTGSKLLHHPTAIAALQMFKVGTPVSLQIAPTSRCNLKCSFCSNVNRKKHENLTKKTIETFLFQMKSLGAKTVEWTGGGDPTQYKHINEVIAFASKIGYQQGFITNGVQLKQKITPESLRRLKWIRISMNALEYVDDIDIPVFNGTLGFSYVWNEKTNNEIFARIKKYVDLYHPSYVRVVPNCQATNEEQIKHNLDYPGPIRLLGEPFFYQAKTFCKPEACYWGYFKPFLLHDGYVYPCSSVVLNDDSDRSFHAKYRWVKAENFMKHLTEKIKPFDSSNCSHCVFHEQNKIIQSVLEPKGMEGFI